MQVKIIYNDNDSLTMEEVVKQARDNYGPLADITVSPDSSMAYDLIYFGLQQLITKEQISMLYEKNGNYNGDIKQLRSKVLQKVTDITDQVIVDNESKVA